MVLTVILISLAVTVVIIFLCLRINFMRRGRLKRTNKILAIIDPIAEKFFKNQEVTKDEVMHAASFAFTRYGLYNLCKYYGKLDLFPQQYINIVAQAEAKLVYWMMHPNEMQDIPEQIELLENVDREIGDQQCKFYVFRYKMKDGHWAAKDGWILGVVGPFIDNDIPYSNNATAFSRYSDKDGEVLPAQLVDWYVGLLNKKGYIPKLTMIEPPWKLHPEFSPTDFYWRDAGQVWITHVWRPFWNSLNKEQKSAYLKTYPTPEEWLKFSIDLNPEFAKFLESSND